MPHRIAATLAIATLLAAWPSSPRAADDNPVTWFEIFKLAPGKQEQFMRFIALGDEVLAAGGQPPVQVYVHQHGAEWDVLLLKPSGGPDPTPEQEAAMESKARELGMPTGAAYFVAIRETVATHTDTKTTGPITAAQWLAQLDAWRAEQAARQREPLRR